MTKWINVKDGLPEDFKEVLTYFEGGGITVCELRDKELYPWRWYVVDFDEGETCWRMDQITHWAELPEPPND